VSGRREEEENRRGGELKKEGSERRAENYKSCQYNKNQPVSKIQTGWFFVLKNN
jgi:hypothetical protein